MPDPQPLTDADRDELVAYLDGELTPEEQQRVEARLSRDPRARAEADTLQRAWDLLDHLPRPEPSRDFTDRTLSRVSALRPVAPATPWYRRPAVTYSAWAAVALLALALGYWLTPPAHTVPPQPVDLETDPVYRQESRLIEHLPLYLAVERLDYLLALDTPDLFGDDASARSGSVEDHRPSAARAADPDRRALWLQYLAAYRRLSPEVQAGLRQLDRDLLDEDVVARVRLDGVMERYAGWLARLPEADRRRVTEAPAGGERLRVVRALLDRQWLDSVPQAYAGRADLIDKWRQDEHKRQQDRLQALRAAEEAALLPLLQQQKFREDVEKFIKQTLEPKLNPRQKQRLETVRSKGTTYAYYHTVLVLSDAHNLQPPGLPTQWERFREPKAKAAAKAPE
jgi:hypothetical protein